MPDFGRPDFGKPDFGPEPSFDEIRRTDSFIDALAGGRPVAPHDIADAELAALLGGWRDELRWPPATGLISEADAIAALNAGRSAKRSGLTAERWAADTPTPRRHRRGLSVVGATAAAVLCIGGFGAVVAGSGPGDSLYGLRTMLFGDSKQVRDDHVGLAAKTELNQVQTLISQGDWEQAQNKLVAVSDQVASIGDQEQKQELLDQFNDLSAKVVERDPEATAPPGVVYTVPPSAAELVPAVAPSASTSTSASTTATGESTTPATSSSPATSTTVESAAPSSTSTGATAPETPSASTSAASPSTSAAPASSEAPAAPAASSEPPVSSSVTAQSETQQTTTPTSAAPSVTTTAAPAVQSDAPAGPTTTPAAPPPPSTPPASFPAAPAPAAETAPAQPQPSAAVTTTVPMPVPVG